MRIEKIDYIGAFLCILITVSFLIWAGFKIYSEYIELGKYPRGRPSRLPFVPLVIETSFEVELTS